jgi:hypothetical protein
MTVKPGDVGFAHTHGAMGALIRLGSWLRLHKGEWNHMFIVSDEVDVDGMPLIIQATLRGVTGDARLDKVAPGGKYATMTIPFGTDRVEVLRFAKAQIGMRYGLLTILAIAIDVVTWSFVPAFRGARKPSWICSALACESLRFGGWLHNWVDCYNMFPQEAYDALVVTRFVVESTP